MSSTRDRVQFALDEARMLMLGVQVLLGFGFQAVLQSTFGELPQLMQYLKLASLGLLLLTLVLLLWPGAFHQIVEGGQATPAVHGFTTRVMGFALLFFALGLGLEMGVAFSRVLALPSALLAAATATAFALACWYGPRLFGSRKEGTPVEDHSRQTPLNERIREVLTETRVVLPGVQALLGFQLIALLAQEFTNLPLTLQYVHLVCLSLVAISSVLLMTPAAYHRVVLDGENTEDLHRIASRLLLTAMVFLALGLAGDFYIVVDKVTGSAALASAATLAMLLVSFGCWFVYTLYRRASQRALSASATGMPRML